MSDGEISGVAGRMILGRPNPNENLGWGRSVNLMCVDTYGSVEEEMSVKFFIGPPAHVGVMAGRPEEFFICTPTPRGLGIRIGLHGKMTGACTVWGNLQQKRWITATWRVQEIGRTRV